VGIRAKFNLLMLAVTIIGAGLFALAANPLIDAIAREEVLQSARIMMDGAAGARKYTAEQITPLLKDRMEHHFYPQAVSAYGAKRAIDVIEAQYPDYTYREAALNPTNPQDRASDWEADIINDFRANPGKAEIALERSTPTGKFIELARPLVTKQACLECHSTAAAAPRSMIAIYGGQNGFGWKLNEVSAAQVVSVPIHASAVRAGHIRRLFVLPFACLILLMYVTINLLLHFVVIRPIKRIAETAEAVSMGNINTPEYEYGASDEIGRLSLSFTRMHRSVAEAFRMLAQA
jgi:HAMP domain-containing protein